MRLLKLNLLPLVALLLASCGGGGDDEGGGDSPSEGAPPPAAVVYTLSYPTVASYYEIDTAIADAEPTTNASALTNFVVSPNLPGGLFLNKLNGKISGTPVGEWMPEDFTITADKAGGGTVSGKIKFGVHKNGETEVDPTSTNPRNFSYPVVELNGYTYEDVTPMIPRYQGDVQTFFQATGLPYGMSVSPTTGVITGQSQYPGDYDVLIGAGSGLGSILTYTKVKLHLEELAPTGLKFTPSTVIFPSLVYVTYFPSTLDRGHADSYSISPALPSGFHLNTSFGYIYGSSSVTLPATTYTLTATNSVGSTTTTFSLEIGARAPSGLSYKKMANRFVRNIAIATLAPSLGDGYASSYAITPALPAGLSFNTTTGEISGTPTTLQSASSHTVTATNSSGSTSAAISIAVVNPGSTVFYVGDGVDLKAYSVDDVDGDGTYLGRTIASQVTSSLVFHPTHDCMTGYSGSAVESYSVDKTQQGALTRVSTVGGVSSPAAIVQTSSGNNIFVANSGFISSYSIDSTCALTFIANVASVGGARDMVIRGSNLFVLGSGMTTQAFRHTGSGVLTSAGTIAMQPHANPGVSGTVIGGPISIAVNAAGTQVFAIDSARAIETYAVDGSTAALTRGPIDVTYDRYYFKNSVSIGDFFIQMYQHQSGDGLASFKMLSGGGLNLAHSPQGTSEVGNQFAGAKRLSYHTSPSGTYVFAEYANFARSGCSRLKFDLSTGILTPFGACQMNVLGGY